MPFDYSLDWNLAGSCKNRGFLLSLGSTKRPFMKVKTTLVAAALVAASLSASAMKTKVKQGDLSALKGTTEFNIQYDYSNMTVTTKNLDEDEFVKEKTADLNGKESGRGTTWARSWVSDRKSRFEPQYKEEFEKQSDVKLAENPSAKYTMIVHTTHTETGYNIGISSRPAYIDAEVRIVETANPSNVIAVIAVDNAPGRMAFGMDFDTGERLKEAYAKMGKEVGKLIGKKI
jgi:hypothetical protein